jgi:hypothetical protein
MGLFRKHGYFKTLNQQTLARRHADLDAAKRNCVHSVEVQPSVDALRLDACAQFASQVVQPDFTGQVNEGGVPSAYPPLLVQTNIVAFAATKRDEGSAQAKDITAVIADFDLISLCRPVDVSGTPEKSTSI